jgi:sulfur relay (sulfurtransferase) DsrF/TusC family protein
VAKLQGAADARFEGIALTGRRVVFLVDMSGSMELVDENTPAPHKWVAVREALVKIMGSLPELEKFQVILFSDKTSYLLGNDGRWIDYIPGGSPAQVTAAMAAMKPKGNTNMYDALDAAFRFKASGLDTIYMLSDGLPNVGAGLTAREAQTLKETERAEILSKHIRLTLKKQWNPPAAAGSRQVRINTVGFFYESPDVGAFLWALARENDGSFVGMSRP